jgi:hypothetical protein
MWCMTVCHRKKNVKSYMSEINSFGIFPWGKNADMVPNMIGYSSP